MQKWRQHLFVILSTGGGAGFVPVAPGTAGTLVAVPVFLLAGMVPGQAAVTGTHLALTAFLALIAIPLGNWAEGHWGRKDPHPFVLDEMAGFLVTVLLIPWDPGRTAAAGFVLFRLFDVAKPFPIRRLEKWPGGVGIVADDLLAGVYANGALRLLAWLWP